jgi:8-oxo-dGTP diphosphatase
VSVRPELCVGAITLRNDHLLLIQRGTEPGRGQWSLPGGRVEKGETMAEAVVREVYEETGLAVLVDVLVGLVERISESHHFVIVDFGATALGDGDPMPGTDAADARWVPIWEVSELDLVDGLLDFLSDHRVIDTL